MPFLQNRKSLWLIPYHHRGGSAASPMTRNQPWLRFTKLLECLHAICMPRLAKNAEGPVGAGCAQRCADDSRKGVTNPLHLPRLRNGNAGCWRPLAGRFLVEMVNAAGPMPRGAVAEEWWLRTSRRGPVTESAAIESAPGRAGCQIRPGAGAPSVKFARSAGRDSQAGEKRQAP